MLRLSFFTFHAAYVGHYFICFTYYSGLTICGVDCLMTAEWKTSNKIIARNVAGNGKGDIIVTTVQGSRGTSTVQFKGKERCENIKNVDD